MATEVVMPQMGESIAEGTITKWMKNVGDHVDRDEPLFEISTDKVDAEIPSPAAGTLTEVRYKEGETVEVNTVVAVLDGNGATPPAKEAAAAAKEEAAARLRRQLRPRRCPRLLKLPPLQLKLRHPSHPYRSIRLSRGLLMRPRLQHRTKRKSSLWSRRATSQT